MEGYDYLTLEDTCCNNIRNILNGITELGDSNLQKDSIKWHLHHNEFMESIKVIENMIRNEEAERSDTNNNCTFISNFEEQKNNPIHQNAQAKSTSAKEDNLIEENAKKVITPNLSHFHTKCSTCNCRYILHTKQDNKIYRTCSVCIARKKRYYKKIKAYL